MKSNNIIIEYQRLRNMINTRKNIYNNRDTLKCQVIDLLYKGTEGSYEDNDSDTSEADDEYKNLN